MKNANNDSNPFTLTSVYHSLCIICCMLCASGNCRKESCAFVHHIKKNYQMQNNHFQMSIYKKQFILWQNQITKQINKNVLCHTQWQKNIVCLHTHSSSCDETNRFINFSLKNTTAPIFFLRTTIKQHDTHWHFWVFIQIRRWRELKRNTHNTHAKTQKNQIKLITSNCTQQNSITNDKKGQLPAETSR